MHFRPLPGRRLSLPGSLKRQIASDTVCRVNTVESTVKSRFSSVAGINVTDVNLIGLPVSSRVGYDTNELIAQLGELLSNMRTNSFSK
ncbi:hypothetical protein TNCV_1402571 [Trichonephila clavipes]|nr:hypothetical protein TNCV_1402571 [Trichonephila clavipes]